MRNKLFILIFISVVIHVCLLMNSKVHGQVPNKMSYQAVFRNTQNELVTNSNIGVQISILSENIDGSAVYVERHFPVTNANGLATLEIGTGVVISGSFPAIDWSGGLYFIKTETDLLGGANYTIASVTQLLSVPYAMHSRTAEVLTIPVEETDPVFIFSPAYQITQANLVHWNEAYGWNNHALAGYLASNRVISINGLARDLSQDRSWNVGTITSISTNNGITGGPLTTTGTIGLTGQALALHTLNTGGFFCRAAGGAIVTRTITAGQGISIVDGKGERHDPVISVKTYKVGDFTQGGVVFWVDETGLHGLVCAIYDQGNQNKWFAGSNIYTMALGDGPLAGKANSAIIIASQGRGDASLYAARVCNEFKVTVDGITYGDWYLPSKEELNLMYMNRARINATAIANGGSAFEYKWYYSSTESSNTNAWCQIFNVGTQSEAAKNNLLNVRAVRAF